MVGIGPQHGDGVAGAGLDPEVRRAGGQPKHQHRVRLLVGKLQRKGFRVYVTGDTNFDGMPLAPLVACWVGHPRKEAAGTLGARTPDYIYAPEKAATVPHSTEHKA